MNWSDWLKRKVPNRAERRKLIGGLDRRSFISWMTAFSMIMSGDVANAQILFSSQGTFVPPGGQITSFPLTNKSATTQATNWCTDMFGRSFKKGDVPVGQYPVFKLTNGTVIPYSITVSPTLWSDGSMKHAGFILRVPASVPGNGAITVNIFNGGTAPAPSTRTLADFAAGGTDIKKVAVGLDNLVGTWVSSINQGAANSDNLVWADGAAGKVWRVRGAYRQGGVDEGTLECYWYAIALTDSAGNLGGLRALSRTCLPWNELPTAQKLWKSFSSLKVQNGATVIRDMANPRPTSPNQVFTWDGGGISGSTITNGGSGYTTATATITAGAGGGSGGHAILTITGGAITGISFASGVGGSAGSKYKVPPTITIAGDGVGATAVITGVSGSGFTATANVLDRAQLIHVSSTGALPAGLSSSTPYWIQVPSANVIQIFTNSTISATVSATDAGGAGAVHTATFYPWLSYYSTLFGAGPDARYDYFQGAGSIATENTCIVGVDRVYWRQTLTIPAYDYTFVPAPNDFLNYYPNTTTPLQRYTETGGERPELGVVPDWHVRYIYDQSAVNERAMLVVAMIGGLIGQSYRSNITRTVQCVNNGPNNAGATYAGMPAPLPSADPGTGNLAVSGSIGTHNTFSSTDASHRCAFHYVPYLATARMEFLDLFTEIVVATIMSDVPLTKTMISNPTNYYPRDQQARNVITPNGTRYAIGYANTQTRLSAWQQRDAGTLAGIMPPAHPECASYKQYFTDMNNTNIAFVQDVIASLSGWSATYNVWDIEQAWCFSDPWQNHGYMTQSNSLNAGLNESAALFSVLQKSQDWLAHYTNLLGGYWAACEQILVRPSNAKDSPFISSDSQLMIIQPQVTSWAIGDTHLTLNLKGTAGANAPRPTVGDTIMFLDKDLPSLVCTPKPGGFNAQQQYYVVSWAVLTGTIYSIEISDTPGGTPIAATTAPKSIYVAYRPQYVPPTTTYTETYGLLLYKGALLAKSRGLTFDATALADLAQRFIGNGGQDDGVVRFNFTNVL